MDNAVEKAKKGSLFSTLLLVASVLLFLSGAVLLLRQYVYIPGSYTPPPGSEAAGVVHITPIPTPKPTVNPSASPTPEPTPTPYIKPVPAKIYFTKRQISTDIVRVQRDEANRMATVDSASLAAWFELGPAPGEVGNALVNGHVRWKKVAGTFSVLPSLEKGEEVVFEFEDGTTKAFYVDDTVYYRFDDPVANDMMKQTEDTRVTLISCYGEMDREARTSEQRVFVVLKPQEAAPPA